MSPVEQFKKQAAEKAVERVRDGMVLGLGTGTSTKYAIIKIGQLWQAGALTDIVGIPTSQETEALAKEYDIPLTTLDKQPVIDLAIDGADEIDPNLDLIKGLGGALVREKIIEIAAKSLIIVADSRKQVKKLGTRSPLPVEVLQFAWKAQAGWLASLGCTAVLRGSEKNPYVTNNHHYILDCTFPHGLDNPAELDVMLNNRPGLVGHGLFLNMATEAIIAGEDGIRVIRK
ncbi:MAG: ribose 5-phosphate isomerase A [Anaerolineae bacterium]|nr:ribose 5-phosphate isomerase A [Anaerolineae bacterium]